MMPHNAKRGSMKADDRPLVSILTPTYNQSEYLEVLLRNIRDQDYPRLEHIVINDGSTDNTEEILKQYQGTYNLKWVTQENSGQSSAVNRAFELSRGELIGWINSDDRYNGSSAISRLAEKLICSKESVVYGNINMINENGDFMSSIRSTARITLGNICKSCGIAHNAALFRRRVFDEFGIANRGYIYTADWDMFIRFVLAGIKFKYVNEIFADFRYHEASKTKCVTEESEPWKPGSKCRIKIGEIITMFEAFLDNRSVGSRAWKALAVGVFPYYRQMAWLLLQGKNRMEASVYMDKMNALAPRLIFIPGIGMGKYLWMRINLSIPERLKSGIRNLCAHKSR